MGHYWLKSNRVGHADCRNLLPPANEKTEAIAHASPCVCWSSQWNGVSVFFCLADAVTSLRLGLVFDDYERLAPAYESVLIRLNSAPVYIGDIKPFLLRPGIAASEIDKWLLIDKKSCDAFQECGQSRRAFTALTFADPTATLNLNRVSLEFDPEMVLGALKQLFLICCAAFRSLAGSTFNLRATISGRISLR